MPLSKLVELGVTCILHEIGQIRLPPQLYMTDKPLSPSEKAQIATHTLLGFNILKDNNFPLAIQLGVLEHHERENGTGYPRHLQGTKISLYAKIISVACSFEAITAPRHYKEARTTYDGMIEMLRNESHQYDETVIKALLYCLSIFPIGAYVYLSNGKIAQVTDVNPNDPRNPVVQVLGETEEDGSPKTIQTDGSTMKIIRVLNKQEATDILNALNLNKK
jgi:HD-GYP domain-containing protein (c-di-GMP phosphodiesterase class II)